MVIGKLLLNLFLILNMFNSQTCFKTAYKQYVVDLLLYVDLVEKGQSIE